MVAATTPALHGLMAAGRLTAMRMSVSEPPPQDAGDLADAGWGGEKKAHTRDPTPTTLDPNDPKSKQTHIPKSESFEEYMKRRAASGK